MAEPYAGAATDGVSAFTDASGAGSALPLMRSYGKISGSIRFMSVTGLPSHACAIWRWKICTVQPSNTNGRETGKPNTGTRPRAPKYDQMASLSMR